MATKEKSPGGLTKARLYEIAVLAVSQLGGAADSIDTEDVAIKCHELAPHLFAWRKYPQQVNMEIVRVSLSDAKKSKNGSLLSGSGRDGWRLTRAGLDWVSHEASTKSVDSQTSLSRRTSGSIDTVRAAREIARIESSSAWAAWKSGSVITPEASKALFRIDGYTSAQLVDLKVTRLLAVFDPESVHRSFLEAASKPLKTTHGAKDG
jgi:hypothetical protein